MKSAVVFLISFLVVVFGVYLGVTTMFSSTNMHRQWDFQSIDTMKYSRDLAREELKKPGSFDEEIEEQMTDIQKTGATYVAIGTPYDEEFLPVMKKWVASARKHGLKVWFRGNFSGWEGWFNYPRIDKDTHTAKVRDFIVNNPDLFEDGDVFTSCTECENGHKVEYGNKQSIADHKQLLLQEYAAAKESFAAINKDVKANYYSMNGDVAKAIMDREMTQELDGVVVIDHYVKDPVQLAQDVRDLAKQSGGTIILGEFGAPIPDIHGKMTEEEQSLWVSQAMRELSHIPELGGLNYWVNKDGSTALWSMTGRERKVVSVVSNYFKGKMHGVK